MIAKINKNYMKNREIEIVWKPLECKYQKVLIVE